MNRWIVDDVNDYSLGTIVSTPLTNLVPYTQYAYYVQAYTLTTEKTGAQSKIQYLTTLPGQPGKPKLKLKSTSSSSIVSFCSLNKGFLRSHCNERLINFRLAFTGSKLGTT